MCDIFCYFSHYKLNIEYIGNVFILLGKYYIHKCKFSSTSPKLRNFLCDFNYLIITLKNINTKKSVKFVKLNNDLLNVT